MQKHILHNLIFNPALPFSKLKPVNTEGNLFMYHLKLLIQEGLVKKEAGGYQLTRDGQVFADKLSLKTFRPRVQPKISTLLVCKNEQGEYLLYKKRRQPFIGLIGFPYGKTHLGEKVLESAARELQEKANLIATLTHRGDVYITIYQDNQLFTHSFFHIIEATSPQGELRTETDIGECFWSRPDQVQPKELIPGVLDIYQLLLDNPTERFFGEFTYKV